MDHKHRSTAERQTDAAPSLVERAAERLQAGYAGAAATPGAKGGRAERPSPGNRAPASERVTIDTKWLAANGYLTPKSMRAHLAEEMRLIKRSILRAFWRRSVERSNLVMVTSAWPEEGKSFVALNLAISMACEMDLHVMLIDADVERPMILNRLGIKQERGLIDVLKDPEMDLSDVILRTDIPRLSVIGPGSAHDMSPELLNSQRMQSLVTELAERYPDRIVLFDTPPVLASAGPSILAQWVGQALFVIESEGTQRSAIDQAIESLPETCEVSLLLNKATGRHGASQIPYYAYRTYHKDSG